MVVNILRLIVGRVCGLLLLLAATTGSAPYLFSEDNPAVYLQLSAAGPDGNSTTIAGSVFHLVEELPGFLAVVELQEATSGATGSLLADVTKLVVKNTAGKLPELLTFVAALGIVLCLFFAAVGALFVPVYSCGLQILAVPLLLLLVTLIGPVPIIGEGVSIRPGWGLACHLVAIPVTALGA